MAKKPKRSRTQTLSLRMSDTGRYALEKSSVCFRKSMTEVIELSLSVMMQTTNFDLPQWIRPVGDEKTITLQRLIDITWHDNEIVRLLRTAIVAPAFLSSEEAAIVVVFFGITPYNIDGKTKDNFWGGSDPFEGIAMTDEYYNSWPKFDLDKCAEHLEKIREMAQMATIDFRLAFQGKLGDLRGIRAIEAPK